MKRLYIFISFVFTIIYSFSINNVMLEQGLLLEYDSHNYYISYELEAFQLYDTLLTDDYGITPFSGIKFLDDYYDYLDEDGMPELPFITVELHLPDYVNGHYLNNYLIETDTISYALHYDYLASQSTSRDDTHHQVSLNDSYYHDYQSTCGFWEDWHPATIEFSEVYSIMGNKGFTVRIFPFRYDPIHKRLIINSHIHIDIPMSSFDQTVGVIDLDSTTNFADYDATLFFDNYKDVYPTCQTGYQGIYLIISNDTLINNIYMDDFIHHKEHLNFDVDVAITEQIGNSSSEIRTFLYNYKHEHTYLRYVLFVGDNSIIPFSDGTMGKDQNPATDIYYACLDEVNIKKQKDLHPDIYIGRWPIRNMTSLKNIIRKTILTELYLNDNIANVAFFSGSGNLSNVLYKKNKWIFNNIVQNSNNNMWGVNIDGRDSYVNLQTMTDALNHETWLFYYNGHGGNIGWASPYHFKYSQIDNLLNNSSLPFQPFGFSLACHTNEMSEDFTDTSNGIGRYWIGCYNGGVTMFGGTSNVDYPTSDYSFKIMFKGIKKQRNQSIGQFTANGMAKYYSACKVKTRKLQVKKMNLYGDPSLMLWGYNCQHQNQSIQQYNLQQSRLNESEYNYSIESENEVLSVQIYSLTGQYVGTYPYGIIPKHNITSGTYIVAIQTTDGYENIKIHIQ